MQYVAFMRAVNVAGHARVTMDDVREAFASAGCRNVRTFIQSGNVLFDCPARDRAALLRTVKTRLRTLLGEEPEILPRSMRDIAGVIERAPFGAGHFPPGVKLYVAFLAGRPRRRPALPLISAKEALEVVEIDGLEAFVVSRPKKNGFFGFPNNFIEEELGVAATSRNWSTVTKIVALARSEDN